MPIVRDLQNAVFGGRAHHFLTDGTLKCLFNVTNKRTRTQSNQVTQHPIESGSDVSDHVIKRPDSFSLDIVLTDEDNEALDPTTFLALSIQQRLDLLEAWNADNKILQLFGYKDTFKNLVIESMSDDLSLDNGTGRGLKISLKQVQIVTSQMVTQAVNQGVPAQGGQVQAAAKPADGRQLTEAAKLFPGLKTN